MYIMTQAEQIRAHLKERYIEPARRRGQTLVTITAGDVHKELGLRNRVPSVCQVMESRILEREARIKVSSRQGPASGRGTRFTITYALELNGALATPKPSPIRMLGTPEEADRLFYSLEGLLKDEFAAAGGGEQWLQTERANFYGPLKGNKNS
jgi:5-methylcytosine-specific restriction protein B